MPKNLKKRELIIKSLHGSLTRKEKKQLDMWEPAEFKQILSQEFSGIEDFRQGFAVYMGAEKESARLWNEFKMKNFPDE